jgi:CO/xanthine dehydrogenase Mo-binding subunit
MTFIWYQPDEDSDGYTTTMPRFSAEDVVIWYGFDTATTQYAMAACGSGGTLSGASAVVAGAAVAFGAAALAF